MPPTDVEMLTGAVTDVGAKIDRLGPQLQTAQAEIRKLGIDARRSRSLIRRLWVLTLIVVILGAALTYVAIDARSTARLAQRNANRAVTQCEVLNNEGLRQHKLWEKVIANQPPAKTPQEAATQAAQVAQFRSDMAEAFVQQDCTKLPK